MICSRCGRDLDKVYIKITTSFEVVSITEEGCSVPYENISEPTSEFLCLDCFNEYCDLIERMNQSNEGKLIADMVQVVDDVQYGSGIPALHNSVQKPSSNFELQRKETQSTQPSCVESKEFKEACSEGCSCSPSSPEGPLSLAEMVKYLDE